MYVPWPGRARHTLNIIIMALTNSARHCLQIGPAQTEPTAHDKPDTISLQYEYMEVRVTERPVDVR